MFTRIYHLRRTKMIVYQLAMIFCVCSESVGTAALSGQFHCFCPLSVKDSQMLTEYVNRLPRPTRRNPKPTSRNLRLQQRLHRRRIIQHIRWSRRRIYLRWSLFLRFILARTSRESLCPVGMEDLCRDCVGHDAEFGVDYDGMIDSWRWIRDGCRANIGDRSSQRREVLALMERMRLRRGSFGRNR